MITIYMKTPDALDQVEDQTELQGLESEQEFQDRVNTIKEKLQQWFEYGESVTLEYDEKTDTLKVRKLK